MEPARGRRPRRHALDLPPCAVRATLGPLARHLRRAAGLGPGRICTHPGLRRATTLVGRSRRSRSKGRCSALRLPRPARPGKERLRPTGELAERGVGPCAHRSLGAADDHPGACSQRLRCRGERRRWRGHRSGSARCHLHRSRTPNRGGDAPSRRGRRPAGGAERLSGHRQDPGGAEGRLLRGPHALPRWRVVRRLVWRHRRRGHATRRGALDSGGAFGLEQCLAGSPPRVAADPGGARQPGDAARRRRGRHAEASPRAGGEGVGRPISRYLSRSGELARLPRAVQGYPAAPPGGRHGTAAARGGRAPAYRARAGRSDRGPARAGAACDCHRGIVDEAARARGHPRAAQAGRRHASGRPTGRHRRSARLGRVGYRNLPRPIAYRWRARSLQPASASGRPGGLSRLGVCGLLARRCR